MCCGTPASPTLWLIKIGGNSSNFSHCSCGTFMSTLANLNQLFNFNHVTMSSAAWTGSS